MPAFVHRLDVAVVRRHDKRDPGGLGAANERGEEPVVDAQHRARARVVHRMPRDIRLEEFVEREVIHEGEAEEMLRRALRRNDRDIRVAVLDRLARQVLHERPILHQVLRDRNRLGGRERHDGRHGLEPPRPDLIRRIHEIGVGEADALVALPKLKKEVVVLNDLPELGSRKSLAMSPKDRRTVHPGEHRRLTRRRLGQPLNPETGVNRLRVPIQETPQRRTNLLVQGIVLRRLS